MDEKEVLNSKRGYLKGDFEFFHLKDRKNMQFEFHYHDFNKIIVFISGRVTYLIEGRAYRLQPWDVLLVSSNEVHKLIVEPGEVYERIVLWVNPAFLEKHNSADCDLSTCFRTTAGKKCNLLRLRPESLKAARLTLSQLDEACKNSDFGNRVLKNSLFLQFVVQVNRLLLDSGEDSKPGTIEFDESIQTILNYINENLHGDLSIDSLAAGFFMSKYYLMHRFKKQTGYSIHNYILQKRLIWANSLIRKGIPAAEASIECGFGDYSSFVRAFKKMFGLSPKKHYKHFLELQKSYEQTGHF